MNVVNAPSGSQAPLPTTQTAMVITAAGGPEVIAARTCPVPSLTSDEVLIAIAAAGVNRHDCNQRARGPSPAHSDILGLEVAGFVRAIGQNVTTIAVGERVCALVDGGGYAQYVAAKAGQTLPIPLGLDEVAGASLPEAAFTFWHNIMGLGALSSGESVLIHGGTSGVGTFSIQALSALGHPVYVTCGSEDKMKVALALGATAAFDYRKLDFVAGVKAATHGRGVDVILDMSGGRYSEQNIEALARRGRLIHLSPGGNARFDVPLRAIMAKEARVTGSMLRPLPDSEKSALADQLRRVIWPLIEAGKIRPVIQAIFALEDAPQAHRTMEQGNHIGKLLLVT